MRLLSSLAELTTQSTVVKANDDKSQRLAGVSFDGELWISKVLQTIDQLEKDTGHVELLVEFDEEERALHNKAQDITASLRKVHDYFIARRYLLTNLHNFRRKVITGVLLKALNCCCCPLVYYTILVTTSSPTPSLSKYR